MAYGSILFGNRRITSYGTAIDFLFQTDFFGDLQWQCYLHVMVHYHNTCQWYGSCLMDWNYFWLDKNNKHLPIIQNCTIICRLYIKYIMYFSGLFESDAGALQLRLQVPCIHPRRNWGFWVLQIFFRNIFFNKRGENVNHIAASLGIRHR